MEEAEILDQAFQLIFAFDEIVALGYRESVNLAQIRTFTEMDSHEEKVYQAVRQVSKSNTINTYKQNFIILLHGYNWDLLYQKAQSIKEPSHITKFNLIFLLKNIDPLFSPYG